MADDGVIAVLADVHGNRWALEAVLADARATGARRFADLGDVRADVVLCGHTHLPRVLPLARYALLHRTSAGWAPELRAIPYPWAAAAAAARERGREDWAIPLETGVALPTERGGW